ncbi:predicted protein [Streptomyces iranensis]|uniref:Uncharacterized protein n=2 Tax=Streptomyces iranensis TaxID=576784 RepID=A0A060ZV92_9ACTN|nr:predicted protein [Streptomyces iranensis]
MLAEMSEWAEGEPLDFDHITRCVSSLDWAGFVPAVTV